MMSETKTNALAVFSYEGNEITFKSENGVMVNATEMAKPFGKRATHWLANQQTKDFIDALSGVRNLTPSELVQVVNGDNGGTERGYFELKKGVRSGSGGVIHQTLTTKVTPRGQAYFINKFLSMQAS